MVSIEEQKSNFAQWLKDTRNIREQTLTAYTERVLKLIMEVINLSKSPILKNMNPNMYYYQTIKDFDNFEKELEDTSSFDIVNRTGQTQSGWLKIPLKHYRNYLLNISGEQFITSKTKYWIYSAGQNSCKWDEFCHDGIMAIGWDYLGDLTQYSSQDEITQKIHDFEQKTKNPKNDSKANWEFANDVQVGDIVYVKKGLKGVLIGRGIVESDYIFDDSRREYKSIRKVNWTHNGEYSVNLSDLGIEQWAQKTLTEISPSKYKDFCLKIEDIFMGNKMSKNISKNIPLNQILYGPPGTGKTYSVRKYINDIIANNVGLKTNNEEQLNSKNSQREIEDFYKFITFHQSYSYEEFVEGIKPRIDIDTENSPISYEYNKGIFKEICQQANSDPDNNYLLIIDEINRGNISKIFGELITLIETDKRVTPNGERIFENTKVQNEQLLVTLTYTKSKFGVPKNLYILGTMNTSDRSIASIDIALRRRFKFIEMMPNKDLVADFGIGFADIFENLNTKIKILLDRDHQIGHSYFIKTKYENAGVDELKTIWFTEVLPLLNEYFYCDWEKLKLIIPAFIKKVEIPIALKSDCEEDIYEFKLPDEVDNFELALKQEKFE
jgi:5-methylcytosine-specific restriction protein B